MAFRNSKLQLQLFLLLTSAMPVHANVCDDFLMLGNWPAGEALRGFAASKVRAEKPTNTDYRAKIKNGSAFEIIQNLPRVSADMPGGGLLERSIEGLWLFSRAGSDSALPPSIAARAEALYQAALSRLERGNLTRITSALRKGSPRSVATEFHRDWGAPRYEEYLAIDSWNGEKTYIQGIAGNIFKVEDGEAVLLKTGLNGALHAAPDPSVFPNSDRVFLRIGFYFGKESDWWPDDGEISLP